MAEAKSDVAKVARALFAGGKCVLVGYDASDKFLIGVGCHPKDRIAWARQGVSKADRARVEKAHAEIKAQRQVEHAEASTGAP